MIWMMRLHAAFALMMRRSFLRLEDDEEVDQSYNQMVSLHSPEAWIGNAYSQMLVGCSEIKHRAVTSSAVI